MAKISKILKKAAKGVQAVYDYYEKQWISPEMTDEVRNDLLDYWSKEGLISKTEQMVLRDRFN